MSGKPRTETDALGAVTVPGDRLWGAQTQRCLDYFKIGSERMPFAVIRALALVKKAAAQANESLGILPADISAEIQKAVDAIHSGRLPRRVPDHAVADRLGHPDQHEHERGDRQYRESKPGLSAGRQTPRSSQRSRQSQSVLQRQLPHRHAPVLCTGDRCGSASAPRRTGGRAAKEGARLRGRRENGQDPPAGRDPIERR